ncbi:hypothetical protein IF188_08245 [Microbacterium sp. NEAU-LLC]|uniref:Uncharacterized protein n=1 Tax=Microbacterium helvum TaxID=2773713 RepID=A0ABR8NLZ4_9MICO|nr:hypothetical protein [Microbacterium helvum]MBD3941682.1 hypothetical protein [Microbacterium helvum]
MSETRYRTWPEIVSNVAPDDRLATVERLIGDGDLDPAEACLALSSLWKRTDYPLRERTVDRWIALWSSLPAFAVSGRLDEAARPRQSMTLYRGAARRGEAAGMSWTPLRLVASMYAGRVGGNVYAATVDPVAMLAAIDRTAYAWQEIVCDPRALAPYVISDHDAEHPETHRQDLAAFAAATR